MENIGDIRPKLLLEELIKRTIDIGRFAKGWEGRVSPREAIGSLQFTAVAAHDNY